MHKRIIDSVDLPLSTIAVYDRAADVLYGGKSYFSEDDVLKGIEEKGKMGVDMITVHASALKEDLHYFKSSHRIIPCTSRCHISLWTLLQIETRKDCIFRFFQRKSSGSA